MRTCLVAFLLFSLAMAARAGEREAFEPGYELAREKGYFDCHALGRTEVGPAFQAIARRYRFDAHAREHLPYVVRGGSAGHWGDRFAMRPQPRLSDAEVLGEAEASSHVKN